MGTPYSAILSLIVTAGVLNIIMGLYSLSGRSKVSMVKAFFVFSMMAAVYAFASALELASGSLNEARIWIKVEYLGMPFLPPLNLLIIMSYLGMERFLKRGLKICMFVIPAVTLVLVMTNEWHHWYYRDIFARAGTVHLKVDMVAGPWYIIQGAYTSACMFGGIVLLLLSWRKMPSYRFQLSTMLIGLILPLAGDFLYLGGVTPDGMDPIPVIMTVTSALYLWALASKGLFHVAPIARDNLFTSMRDGVLVLDRDHRLVDYNPAAAAMMPELGTGSIGQPLYGIWQRHTDEPIRSLMSQEEDGNYFQADIQEIEWCVDKRKFHYQIRTSTIRKQGGQEAGRLIVLIDVTERTRLQEELRQMAYHDGLTRIYNRMHFMKQSNLLLSEALKHGENLAFLMFDIDHFKRINDIYGHDIGDQALLYIVAICKEALRPEDLFARYGGEEFVIALPGYSAAMAIHVAERIRSNLAQRPMPVLEADLYITASFGIAATEHLYGFNERLENDVITTLEAAATSDSSDTGERVDLLRRLLKLADRALYDAKGSGRDTICVADQTV